MSQSPPLGPQSPSTLDLTPFIDQIVAYVRPPTTDVPAGPTTAAPSRPPQPRFDVNLRGHKMTFRLLQRDDHTRGFIELLGQLTKVTPNPEAFMQQFDLLSPDYIIIVVDSAELGKIVGAGTLMIERKFIRNFSSCGHIEDVVVDSEMRRMRVGYHIVSTLSTVAHRLGCYKTILDCSEDNEIFYLSCGFKSLGLQMGQYH